MLEAGQEGRVDAPPRSCWGTFKYKLCALPIFNVYGLLIFVVAAGNIALVTFLQLTELCVPPENPSRLAGCTCYLDDSYSLEDCPAWNLEDPRPNIQGVCACDIVYVSVIKPYTDVTHANTCNLWWDPTSPDYDPDYFTTAKRLGEKYNKRVWAMTPYKFGEIPPWDEVRFCIGKAAEVGLVFEGLYVNFEWKGCRTDGPECLGDVNGSACITPEMYPGFCASTPSGTCTSSGGWQDLGVPSIRSSIGETARAPFVYHTCNEEWGTDVVHHWMCNDEGEPSEFHPCKTCSNDAHPEWEYLFHWQTGVRNPPGQPFWFEECDSYRPDLYIDVDN